ncbi:protein SUPPRESSOR OF PHYTOCHROME B 5 [Nymphaea colorata]|nr:protein SUPPRESSOR OF PHYTOCHROME B 5 [Nymphaea colorata]
MEPSKLFGRDEESGWTSILCDSLYPEGGDDGVGHDDHVDDDDEDDDSLASDASSGRRNHDCRNWGDALVDKAADFGYSDQHGDFDDNDHEDAENADCYGDGGDVDGDGGRNYGLKRVEKAARKWRQESEERVKDAGNRARFASRRMDDSPSQCSSTKGPTKQGNGRSVTTASSQCD